MHAEIDDELGLGVSEDEEGLAARAGLAADVYITPNILGTLEVGYVYPADQDLKGLDYLSVGWGFQYRF